MIIKLIMVTIIEKKDCDYDNDHNNNDDDM